MAEPTSCCVDPVGYCARVDTLFNLPGAHVLDVTWRERRRRLPAGLRLVVEPAARRVGMTASTTSTTSTSSTPSWPTGKTPPTPTSGKSTGISPPATPEPDYATYTPSVRSDALLVRDPSAPYASGIRAAPQAKLAVDRWHLVALERHVDRGTAAGHPRAVCPPRPQE